MSASTQTLERPEGRIGYDVTGDGPLVVCLPGMGELRSVYRFTVPALAAAGFRVATMDLRGHGDSDAGFSSYDDVAAGTDALALIEQLGGPAVLVGNSMGAGAAVWAAAERPDLVAGIALIGPFVRNPKINPLMAWTFRAMMSGPWATRMWLSYLPRLYPARKPADFAEHVASCARRCAGPGTRRRSWPPRTPATPRPPSGCRRSPARRRWSSWARRTPTSPTPRPRRPGSPSSSAPSA